MCDQKFFAELMKEAAEIAGCFRSRVKHLLHLHVAPGMQRYMLWLGQCVKNDPQDLVREGQMLMEYLTMNAIAIRKILKKYDKVWVISIKHLRYLDHLTFFIFINQFYV